MQTSKNNLLIFNPDFDQNFILETKSRILDKSKKKNFLIYRDLQLSIFIEFTIINYFDDVIIF